jgi:hypothetical protein
MRAALSSSSGRIISSDDTGANSFQRKIVDRAVLSLKDAGSPFLFDGVKKLAQRAYDGNRGYQPVLALWGASESDRDRCCPGGRNGW